MKRSLRSSQKKNILDDIDDFLEKQFVRDDLNDHSHDTCYHDTYYHNCEENSSSDSEEDLQFINKKYKFFDPVFYYVKKTIDLIAKIFNWTIKIAGVYFIWVGLHFVASHLYTEFCTSKTIYGFFISPFIVMTPHCQALRWLINNGAIIIKDAWLILGTWFCSQMLFYTNQAAL